MATNAPPQLLTPGPLAAYLRASPYLDFDHPAIASHLNDRSHPSGTAIDTIRERFEFVRDQIAHSSDIQSHRVTRRASEVLIHREGICYAKAHLLAALLRAAGIPAGLCYQRLTQGATASSGHVVHGLNTVYLTSEQRWIRLDPRGNKPGIDAQFSLAEERLAFPVREEAGEIDYPINYAEPHPAIIEALEGECDMQRLYGTGRLPASL